MPQEPPESPLESGPKVASPDSATTDPYRAYRDVRYFSSLDGIRCFCILAVIWHHGHPDHFKWLADMAQGYLGVDMFFILSGFLIVTLLLREQDKYGAISLKQFYARRVFRIFPLYFGIMFGLMIALPLLRPDAPATQRYFELLPYYLTFTANFIPIPEHAPNLGVTWSLAVEEQFYLLWPPILAMLRPRHALALLAAIVLLIQVYAMGWIGNGELGRLPQPFMSIGFGVILAHTLHSPRGFLRAYGLLGGPWTPVILTAATLALVFSRIGGETWLLAVRLMFTLVLASCVVREDHRLAPLLRFGPIRRIGAISYGMYLLHLFTMSAIAPIEARIGSNIPTLRFWLMLGITVVLAELSYRFYEQPFLKLGVRFRRIATGHR
ncbi:MAG: acyltransferase family protein [Phycisphaera sp.]|nr:acyltransferase family protein [Phycisphaera sp.]